MKPTSPELRPRTSLSVKVLATVEAIVISRPSRIQATPSAMIMRVKNGDQGSRSMRAGMVLRIGSASGCVIVDIGRLLGPDQALPQDVWVQTHVSGQ